VVFAQLLWVVYFNVLLQKLLAFVELGLFFRPVQMGFGTSGGCLSVFVIKSS